MPCCAGCSSARPQMVTLEYSGDAEQVRLQLGALQRLLEES